MGDMAEGWADFRSRTWLWVTTVQFAFFNLITWAPWMLLGPVMGRAYLGGAAVPPEMLARVSSLTWFHAYGIGVIGYAIDGPLSAALGTSVVFGVGAAYGLLSSAVVLTLPSVPGHPLARPGPARPTPRQGLARPAARGVTSASWRRPGGRRRQPAA
jgi:hypothetical protein